MGRLVRCHIPLSSRDCPICILKFSSVNEFKSLAWSIGMPMTWSSPFWPAWSPGMCTQWESRDQAWGLPRAANASSPLGGFSRSPRRSVFHKSLHLWLSLLSPSCEAFFFFFLFPPYRDHALFFCFSTESSLALGGKSQGTERQLNTNSTSRQSSLLWGHLPAYQMLWLNSSVFVLDIINQVQSYQLMRLLTSLLASTSRVINSDASPSWPYKFP